MFMSNMLNFAHHNRYKALGMLCHAVPFLAVRVVSFQAIRLRFELHRIDDSAIQIRYVRDIASDRSTDNEASGCRYT